MDNIAQLLGRTNYSNRFVHIYECYSCSECFEDVEALARHLSAHEDNTGVPCQHCKKNFSSLNARREHYCLERFVCSYCGELQDSTSRKKAHEQKHKDKENGIQCEICAKNFSVRCALNQHCRTEHSNTQKEFSCSQCPRKYKYESRLKFHVKKTHTESTAYKCKECDNQLKDRAALQDHRNLRHSVVNKVINCSICQELVYVHSMNKHLENHKSNSKKIPVACDECNLSFPTNTILKDHKRKSHLKCKPCDLKFPSKYVLKKHNLSVHRIEDNAASCPICGKLFSSSSDFKRHLKSHYEERLIKCGSCGFVAKTKGTLRSHNLTKHSNVVKVHKCELCSLTYTRSSDLTRHKKIHTQKKLNFSCHKCHKKFEYESSRDRHERLGCNNEKMGTQDVAVNIFTK